jgi:hypothetical protein
MSVYPENLVPNSFLKNIIKSRITEAITQGYEGFAEVRTAPSNEAGETAFQVVNNKSLRVTDARKDAEFDFYWLEVINPNNQAETGWLDSRETWYSYSDLAAEIDLSITGSPVYLSNVITGGGSHAYTFAANKFTTIEIHVFPGFGGERGSPSPILTDPNGQQLTPFDDYTEWVGKAPFEGFYNLSLASNFKGFSYAFSIRAIFFD